MKSAKFYVMGVMLLLSVTLKAQFSVNVTLGSPPMWGPAGYSQVRYYYLPDVEAYYDVQTSMFIYSTGGRWVHHKSLPYRYRNYDLYGGYKVVMNDYHGNSPYSNYREDRIKYARGYRGQEQRNIGERPGNRNSRERIDTRNNSHNTPNKELGNSSGNERKNMKKSQNNSKEKGKKK